MKGSTLLGLMVALMSCISTPANGASIWAVPCSSMDAAAVNLARWYQPQPVWYGPRNDVTMAYVWKPQGNGHDIVPDNGHSPAGVYTFSVRLDRSKTSTNVPQISFANGLGQAIDLLARFTDGKEYAVHLRPGQECYHNRPGSEMLIGLDRIKTTLWPDAY